MDGVPATADTTDAQRETGSDDVDGEPIEGAADEGSEDEDVDGVPLSVPVASILAATGVEVNDDDEGP